MENLFAKKSWKPDDHLESKCNSLETKEVAIVMEHCGFEALR